MFSFFLNLKKNYAALRSAVNMIGEELEKKTVVELDMLLDNKFEAHTIEREIDGVQISFDFQSWGQDKKTGCPGYCVYAEGLPTLFGVKPGYHFYKRQDGTVYY